MIHESSMMLVTIQKMMTPLLMMDQLVDRLASKKFVDQLVDRFVSKISFDESQKNRLVPRNIFS